MRHWIDIDTCIICGHVREFSPIYDKKTKDWVCDKCKKLKNNPIKQAFDALLSNDWDKPGYR